MFKNYYYVVMGNNKSKQMSETVNEALQDITKSFMVNQQNKSQDSVDLGQFINLNKSKINCLGDLNIGQTIDSKITMINEFTPQTTLDLKDAIKNGLDAKVNEKLTKDSGPLTMFSKPTDQSSKLTNKMSMIIDDKLTIDQINDVIRENNVKQKVLAAGSDIVAFDCNITQDMYIDMIVTNIVKPVLNAMKESKYIQELETEKKVDMFNGLGMNQMIALIVSCVASVLMMMIGLAMIKAFKGDD